MNNEGNMGLFEAVCLTTLIMMNKIFYTSTAVLVKEVGTASWYATIISCIVSLLFFYLIYLLMKRFPGFNIIQIFEEVLGKISGKAIGILFCIYAVYYTGSNLREFVDMIKTYNFPYTPESFILVSIISVAILISYYGVESIGRISSLTLIPLIVCLGVLFILASSSYNANYLKPYFGYGFVNTLYIGFLRSSAYDEVVILFIIVNSIHGLKNLKKAGIISILLTGIIFSISYICYLLTFTYSVGKENISGLFELSKTIYFNRFFQRVESIFLITWIIPSIIATAIEFYISVSIYCKVFTIKEYRPLLLPFSFLTFIIAILPRNFSQVVQINMLVIRQYSMLLVYFIPTIVLIISILFKKKGGNANAQKN